ncbi:MAG: thiosulfate sulfurtransferase, partial [Deltaproteobacteria bacterium]|nr:thiosulfate sulfurtransferase [Deltaproteobacteria bacterium]
MDVIYPKELKEMIGDGREIALIDVREQGAFYREHQLFASSIPLSQMELRISDMVPRRAARIVLVDGGRGDNMAERAGKCLEQLGYTNIAILDGGIKAWKETGYEIFSGVNVPSKAFGEIVERTCNTSRLTAGELKAKIDSGEKLVILDSRPKDEYHRMNIPGGINTPGAELVMRIHDLAPDPETFVVVNCAGRTRSIIGTQSLINAGIPNPVAALKDGTMGWHLAGFELEQGMERYAPAPSPEGLLKAREFAGRVGKRFGVQKIDHSVLDKWMVERGDRTLYVFDVRLPEEFESGHLEYSRNAPGGQLVQATDEYMA